jgi:hypothetical protein
LCNIINLSESVIIKSSLSNHPNKVSKEFRFVSNKRTVEMKYVVDTNYSTRIRIVNLFGRHLLRQEQLRKSLAKSLARLINTFESLALFNFHTDIYLLDMIDDRIVFESNRKTSIQEKFIDLFLSSGSCITPKQFQLKRGNFEIDGLICTKSTSSKEKLNSNAALVNLLRSPKKSKFIFLNKFCVANKDLHEIVENELTSCEEFRLFNLESSDDLKFCLIIKCTFSEYKIEFGNNEQKYLAQFRDCNLARTIVKEFVCSFLEFYNFRKKSAERLNLESQSKKVEVRAEKLNDSDFKFTKFSKRVREVKTTVKPPAAFFRCSIKVNSTPCLKKNLELLIAKSCDMGSLNRKKLSYSDLLKRIESISNNNLKSYVKKAEKTTQTETSTFEQERVNDKNLKLKPEWAIRTDNRGVEYYLNLVDGTSAYDLKLAKDKTPAKLNTYDKLLKLAKEKPCGQDNANGQRVGKDDLEFRKEVLENMSKLIHKNVLVKWRHVEELKNFENLTNIRDIDPNSLDFGSSIKFDKNIFKDLRVCIH